jgi:hypothetical protein
MKNVPSRRQWSPGRYGKTRTPNDWIFHKK